MNKNRAYWKNLIQKAIDNQLEQNDLDFKADLSEKSERLKEHINAFGHTNEGGAFVFGISDAQKPFKYTGALLNYSEIQQKISSLAQDTQEPPLGVENFTVETSLGEALCIYIHEGVTKPIFIKNRAPMGGKACFKRAAASTTPISIEEVRVLLAQSTQHTFDESPVQDAKIDDLDFKKIEETFTEIKASKGSDEHNLRILLDNGIICKSADHFYPTIAGFLMFSKNPQGVRSLSNSYVEFQQFRENTRAAPIKKVAIKGNLQEQIQKSIELLMQYLWVMPKIEKGGKRVEIPAYDEEIIREVITNALVHRDYTKMYNPVKIALFKDRVEVENIGGLMPGLTTLNFVNKRDWRNPLLAQLTKKVGFGEMDGQGIDRIYALARQIHVPTPIFEDDQNSFKAILLGPKPFDSLEPEQKRMSVIVLLIFERLIDNELLRNNFNIKAEQATNLIKSMVEEGIIVPANKSRKYAKYRLSQKYVDLVNS